MNGPLRPKSFLASLTYSHCISNNYRNGEEAHREDRGLAAGRKLLLPRVLPSEDSNGGVTPRMKYCCTGNRNIR